MLHLLLQRTSLLSIISKVVCKVCRLECCPFHKWSLNLARNMSEYWWWLGHSTEVTTLLTSAHWFHGRAVHCDHTLHTSSKAKSLHGRDYLTLFEVGWLLVWCTNSVHLQSCSWITRFLMLAGRHRDRNPSNESLLTSSYIGQRLLLHWHLIIK